MTLKFTLDAILFVASITITIVGTLTILVWMLKKLLNFSVYIFKGSSILLDYILNRKTYKQWKVGEK